MNQPNKVRGHFTFVYAQNNRPGVVQIQSTVTNKRKSKVAAKEAAKKAALLKELEKLTGHKVDPVAHSLDGIQRRWSGVKGNASE